MVFFFNDDVCLNEFSDLDKNFDYNPLDNGFKSIQNKFLMILYFKKQQKFAEIISF